MSWWAWLKQQLAQTFLGHPPPRKIAQLESQGEATQEPVDRGGGPLRPRGQRLAHRDARLWPKSRPLLRKRPKVMEASQAEVLFSPSCRTRNRQLRDLLWDPEQLRRLGLPLWQDEAQLAQALEIPLARLRSYASYRVGDKICHYTCFSIPKAQGGERLIVAPKRGLKAVQRRLLKLCLEKLPQSEASHGFRAGRSVASAAAAHVGQEVVIRFDLADFFPSCTWERVRGLLIGCGYSFPLATRLALLASESERQPVDTPQGLRWVPVGPRHCVAGAPTSPALANALVLRMDRRLLGLARKLGFRYTRYADDLTFSAPQGQGIGSLCRGVEAIVQSEGFHLRHDKTKVMRRGQRQRVLGVTVNDQLGLSRQERRRLRAALHQGRDCQGKLAYLHMLNPEQAARLGFKT